MRKALHGLGGVGIIRRDDREPVPYGVAGIVYRLGLKAQGHRMRGDASLIVHIPEAACAYTVNRKR